MERFANRREAGKALAHLLRTRGIDGDALVLALPRGGVPVAFEIARALDLSLDAFVVRKLGVPRHEELAMGAIASGGARVLNREIVERLGISDEEIDAAVAREEFELERRQREYRGDLPFPDVHGKTIILVDDGLATGATMRAAVKALQQNGAGRIIVAVPVGAADSCEAIAREGVEVICPLQPENFQAVGAWYDDFSQTTDAEVCELLAEAHGVHSHF